MNTIQKPYVLAEIPQDYTGSDGQILTASVQSLSGAKKRKRSELVAAIDRQGINIYDVPNSKLITSYAISPQAVFTCAPCSLLCRRQEQGNFQRITYCSVALPKPQIICFSETTSTRSTPGERIQTASTQLSKDIRPVVALETLYVPGDDGDPVSESKILAIHADGTVTCYSYGLVTQEWNTGISSVLDSTAGLHVEHAMVIGVDVARQTLWKNRDDILATLGNAEEQASGNLLLTIVRTSENKEISHWHSFNLMIFEIGSTNPIIPVFSADTRRKLKLLSSTVIHKPSQVQAKTSTITIHPASATIYQESAGVLAIFNLTSLIPRLVYIFDSNQDAANRSYLRLSTNLVACSNASSISVVELPYYSIQAERSLTDIRKPRELAHRAGPSPPLRLLSYYTPSGLAVALYGRKIFAIQLLARLTQDSGSKKRKRDGLLVNAIGRSNPADAKVLSKNSKSGRKIRSLGTYSAPSSASAGWDDQKTELERCAARGDTEQFEAVASSLLGNQLPESNEPMLQSTTHSRVHQRVLYFILSKIFSLGESHQPGPNGTMATSSTLKIRLLPRAVFNWLVDRGLLTVNNIEKSLKHAGVLPPTSKLATGLVLRAFEEWDSSLELLSTLIDSSVPLSSGELVHALAMATRDINAAQSTGDPYSATNGEENSKDSDVQMQLTNSETKESTFSAVANPPKQQHHHRILLSTMKKLHTVPRATVSHALKTELSTPQLRTLVDALRMEIARSGWLFPYEDTLPGTNHGNPQNNHQLSHIAHLLNSTIDGIGTAGWILGTSLTDDFSDSADTIAYMRAEISAALEGIEEATYLRGMLEEVLICGKDTLQAQGRLARGEARQGFNVSARSVTVALEEVSNALPLGLKPKRDISTTKVGAGGELLRRSKRDIGRLKSQMVGKYTFERIEI